MCGRARCALAPERIEQITGVPKERWVDRDRYQPTYNASPGSWTPILKLDNDQHTPMLQTMRWGLVPSFTKPGASLDFYRMFNARSETVAEKSVFSRLLSCQRCVVLLEGFFEWKAEGGKKQPYFVSLGEGKAVRMAGLYDVYAGAEGGPLATYTILTVDSCPKLQWLHDRMPVLLEDDAAVEAWLRGRDNTPQAPPLKLCAPCNSEALTWHPVTKAMSKPDYNKPDTSTDVRKKKGAITSFFKASPVKASPPAAATSVHKAEAARQQQQQQQVKQEASKQQQLQGAMRNSDQQEGPSAADEAAALKQMHTAMPAQPSPAAAGAGVHGGNKRQHAEDAAAPVGSPGKKVRTG